MPIPPRSTLYSLEPVGVGTPMVECLTSYLSRLAEAHCVLPGILTRKLIAPFLQQNPIHKGVWQAMHLGNGLQTYAFNSPYDVASGLVHALETMTQQHLLRFLTFLTWAGVFSSTGLLRHTQAWCPACLEEWHMTHQTIYQPLLWTLRAVTFCMRHQCKLNTRCPQKGCEREVPWLAWSGLPGHCPYCRTWLGALAAAPARTDETEVAWQQWITEQIGEILACAPTILTPPPRTRIRELLIHFSQQMNQGGLRACARSLVIPWSTFATWLYHPEIPQLETLLSICARCGVSLRACLLDDMTTIYPHQRSEAPRPQKDKHQSASYDFWNSPQIQHALEAILTDGEDPPPSLREVARRFECSTTILRKHHRELCYAISARYLLSVQERKQAALQRYCEDVRYTTRQLAAQGKRPTRKRLAEVLTKPGILRSPEIREAWQEVLHEIDEDV